MGHLSYNENSIALPSDRGTLEVSGANLMYEGARVKSWMLGRDVNPAGRGDGAYYAQGAFSIGSVRPSPTTTPVGGWGNSVNNGCEGCGPRGLEPPSPPDGSEGTNGNKYEDCFAIAYPVCMICPGPGLCTPEEWNDPSKHEECCERLKNVANCDPCIKEKLNELLECFECVDDPCKKCIDESQERQNRCFDQYKKDIRSATNQKFWCDATVNVLMGLCFAGLYECSAACILTGGGALRLHCCLLFCKYGFLLCMCGVKNLYIQCENTYQYHLWAAEYELELCLYDDCVARKRCFEANNCPVSPNCTFNPPQMPSDIPLIDCPTSPAIAAVARALSKLCFRV